MFYFGRALEIVKDGGQVTRTAWEGAGLSLSLRRGTHGMPYSADERIAAIDGIPSELFDMTEGATQIALPSVLLRSVSWQEAPDRVMAYTPSQEDMLAEDWFEL